MAHSTLARVLSSSNFQQPHPARPVQQDLALTRDSAADSHTLAAHEQRGFELGWDHAHHGIAPPRALMGDTSPLRLGWQAGRATFGLRTLQAGSHTARWLALRCHAWRTQRSFETTLLTPNLLQQLDVPHCPITRHALVDEPGHPQERSLDRVRDDAGYAAGHVAFMSREANRCKASHGWATAREIAHSLTQGPLRTMAGLHAHDWRRIAVLCSFVTELPHDVAAHIPLHLLPPNRLRLLNPIQALQALVSRQLGASGWSERLARIESLLPSDTLKADFNRWMLALAPRVLSRGALVQPQHLRWALEDAWDDALVQRRWTQFALKLSPEQAQHLAQCAAALPCSPVRVQAHSALSATEGWWITA